MIFLRRCVSAILGSMSRETSCVMKLTYFTPGCERLASSNSEPSADRTQTVGGENDSKIDHLLRGMRNLRSARDGIHEFGKSDQTIQKHRYFSNRQFAGYPVST